MTLIEKNTEIFLPEGGTLKLDQRSLELIKSRALENKRKRARICGHASDEEKIHEMVIAISSQCYVHPHKHINKSKSYQVIEGELDKVIFDDEGNITDVVEMGPLGSGKTYYFRMTQQAYNTILIKSDMIVVHEVTNGPFSPDTVLRAPFAPEEGNTTQCKNYIDDLKTRVRAFLNAGSEST